MKSTALPLSNNPDIPLQARADCPVSIYYCKAGIKTGMTTRVLHNTRRYECRGVQLVGTDGAMEHNNTTGVAKASGARCMLVLTRGTIWLSQANLLP